MRLSLRYKFGMGVTSLLVVLTTLLLWPAYESMRTYGEESLQDQAQALTHVLAAAAGEMLAVQDDVQMRRLVRHARRTPDVAYVVIRDPAGKKLASSGEEPPAPEPMVRIETPIYDVNESGRNAERLGTITLFMSHEGLNKSLSALWKEGVTSASLYLSMILLIALIIVSRWIGPINRLTEATRDITATGNLAQKVDVHSRDEVGDLAFSIRRLVIALKEVVRSQVSIQEDLENTLTETVKNSDAVGRSSTSIRQQVQSTRKSMDHVRDCADRVSSSIRALRESGEEGARATQEAAMQNDEVINRIRDMTRSIDSVTQAVDEIALSVALNTETLSEVDRSLQTASDNMGEVRSAVEEIRDHANRTAQLSQRTTSAAHDGAASAKKAIQRMKSISADTEAFSSTMEQLTGSLHNIGEFVNFINLVADRTTLLALNASIIASQSGEYGAGFSVVAREIKHLAGQARASTHRIVQIVFDVEETFERAKIQFTKARENVKAGVSQTQEASETFGEIEQWVVECESMMSAIAQTTAQQSDGINDLTQTISEISQRTRRLRDAAQVQTARALTIQEETGLAASFTEAVQESTSKQALSTAKMVQTIGQIDAAVRSVDAAQLDQSKTVQGMLKTTQGIYDEVDHQDTTVSALHHALRMLKNHWFALRGPLRRFRT